MGAFPLKQSATANPAVPQAKLEDKICKACISTAERPEGVLKSETVTTAQSQACAQTRETARLHRQASVHVHAHTSLLARPCAAQPDRALHNQVPLCEQHALAAARRTQPSCKSGQGTH